MPPPRKLISEVVARHRLQPAFRDIYVEGPTDKFFYSWVVRKLGYTDCSLYEIGSIEIPEEHVQSHGFSGNKGRVIALANALHDGLACVTPKVACIVDKDIAAVRGTIVASPYLFWTDFSCLESYAATNSALSKFYNVCFGKDYSPEYLLSFFEITKSMFALRCALEIKNLNSRLLDFRGYLTTEASRVLFDVTSYIQNLCISRGVSAEVKNLSKEHAQQISAYVHDERNYVHGHDLVELVSWHGKQLNVDTKLRHEDVVGKSLIASIDFADIQNYPLVENLNNRLA